jgi:hypothetical protein
MCTSNFFFGSENIVSSSSSNSKPPITAQHAFHLLGGGINVHPASGLGRLKD